MSGIDATQLLKRLGGISAGAASPAAPTPPVGTPEFAALLGKARAGEAGSGSPVTVDPAAELAAPLSEEDLARVAQALDRAEANGASRALVLLDRRALRVDVLTRRVTGETDLASGQPAVDVDAVVRADPPAEQKAALGPPRAAAPPAVARLLDREDDGSRRDDAERRA